MQSFTAKQKYSRIFLYDNKIRVKSLYLTLLVSKHHMYYDLSDLLIKSRFSDNSVSW